MEIEERKITATQSRVLHLNKQSIIYWNHEIELMKNKNKQRTLINIWITLALEDKP
jgi:hypothetical protein